MSVQGIDGKRKEQGRWEANIDDLSMGAEFHLEDGASMPSRKVRKRHTRRMETASPEIEGRDAKDGKKTEKGQEVTEMQYRNAVM